MKMIIEQTKNYPKRMIYDPQTGTFAESGHYSLAYVRHFAYPYGWIKESGTPPEPHCDCILMSETEYGLGEEVSVRIIGMFKRGDGDHKYLVVEEDRAADDYEDLTGNEKEALRLLYPQIRDGEGWFGKEEALFCYTHCEKSL